MNERSPHSAPSPELPHVVIIGCGFGGLEATRALRSANVRISLIDRTNHHLFQPLLYQVATAGLSAPAIADPIRHLFRDQKNVTTLFGEVTAIDALQRNCTLSDGTTETVVSWDHLIVASGATHSYFGNDAWAPFAPGLKTLEDAFEIRRRVLSAFESAEKQDDAAKRKAWLTFAVIGGGPTGVEMAGTLAEIARHTLAGEFRNIDPAQAHVLLVEGNDRVLQAMPESLSEKAKHQLQKLGVEVRLKSRVIHIDENGLRVHPVDGEEYFLDSKCVVWAAGVAASSLGKMIASQTGVATDRAGRVVVESDLSIAGHDHISVIGDLASAKSYPKGKEPTVAPGVSPAAKQMGRYAAANILRRIKGEATRPFVYSDYGNLATIGRNSAVVDLSTHLGPLRFSGYFAWLFWLFAHIYFLIGFRNRIVVMIDWASAYWSFQRYARVVATPAKKKIVEGRDQTF